MKILIIGLGSIGKRHAKNLLKLRHNNLIFCTKNNNLPKELRYIKKFTNLSDALKERPNVAFICNETNLHCKTAIKCVESNCHLFIEKPLGNKIKEIKNLQKKIEKKKVVNMVGYMMRFHPAIKEIKRLLQKKHLGRLFYAYGEWGEYLPNWHPKENYKKSYAAKKNSGGSSITLSHDLDLFRWFFGPIKKVSKEIIKNTKLKIKAESASDFLIKFKSDLNAFIHVDYLQKKPSRYLKIVGEEGLVTFKYNENKLTIAKFNEKTKIVKFKKFERNHMFIDEIKYFLKNSKNKQNNKHKTFLNIKESIDLFKETKII